MPDTLYYEKRVTTNDFGNIWMTCVDLNYNFSNRNAYVNESMHPMTVLDGKLIYDATPNTFNQLTKDYLVAWHTEAEIASAEYKAKVKEFTDSVYWLSGKMSQGGIFFYKDGNGQLHIGCMYSFGYRMNGDSKEYAYAIQQDPNNGIYTDHALEQICLGFTAFGEDIGDFPPIVMFSKQNNTQSKLWVYEPWNSQTHEDTDDLEEAVGNCEWSGGNPEVAWDNANIQRLIIAQNPFTEYSGSWSGGTAVDPKYNPYNDDSGPSEETDPERENPDPIDIDDPNESGVDACNSGFITLYNPTKEAVIGFNDFLFTDITDPLSEQLKRLIADPMDYLVFIAMCHFAPTASAAQHEILFAGLDSGVSAPIISQQFKVIDCGTLYIPLQNQNFTDYGPYSKIEIFLPYIGFRSLNIDEARGTTLNVSYVVDLMSGSFECVVRAYRGPRGFWTRMDHADWELNSIILTEYGNCYEMLPLSSTDFRTYFSAIVGAVSGGMVSGGPVGAVAGGIASAVTNISAMKPNVQRSSNGASNSGYYGNQTPFVIVTYPFGANPDLFGDYEGYPSNIAQPISNCNNGYVEIDTDTIWMDDIPCLDDEMNEIKELLNKGVWVNV